ncbi:MAG: hypothetical protein OEM15_07825 [Myxococcales bacterium]|nr:hypothetical protein [Myxococcales bacterium]MDH3485405.1 hypothetical protein [Myxococcales bacterium]
MRYLFGFLCVCALAALPKSASAQAAEQSEATETEQAVDEEPAPSSEPAPEEPALQLKVGLAGVEVVPSTPRTTDGYTIEESDLRVRRAAIGLGVSVVSFMGGFAMVGVGAAQQICIFEDSGCPPAWAAPVLGTGVALILGGAAGTIASGIAARKRKRKRDSLRAAHYGRPPRVQWDLETSRIVF